MGQVLVTRMPSGIAGDISRRQSSHVESCILNTALPFASYGVPVKFVAGKAVPLAGGETGAEIRGLLVRPFPTQTAAANGSGIGSLVTADVLRRGYLTVVSNAGTPAKDGVVYVRIAAAAGAKVINGIEAVADGVNTVVVPNARFTGAADASGNVEIEYNL